MKHADKEIGLYVYNQAEPGDLVLVECGPPTKRGPQIGICVPEQIANDLKKRGPGKNSGNPIKVRRSAIEKAAKDYGVDQKIVYHIAQIIILPKNRHIV